MSSAVPRQCERLRERLPEYAEGRLLGEPRAAVEQHLAECRRCTQEVADLRAVLAALQSLPAEEMPKHLLLNVRRAVGQHIAGQRRVTSRTPWSSWTRIAIPASAAVGLLAVMLGYRLVEQGYVPKSVRGAVQGTHETAPRVPATAPAPTGAESLGAAGPTAGARLGIRESAERQGKALGHLPPILTPPAPTGDIPESEKDAATSATELPRAEEFLRESIPKALPADVAPSRTQASGGGMREEERPLGVRVSPRARKTRVTAPSRGKGRAGTPTRRRMPNQAALSPMRSGRPRSSWQERGGLAPPGPAISLSKERDRGGPTPRREAFHYGTASAEEREGVPSPTSALALLVREGDRLALAVKLQDEPRGEMVEMKTRDQLLWRGIPASDQRIVLPREEKNGGPQAIPLTLTSPSGSRGYTLFAPPLSQLGLQSGTARKRYEDVPLASVLSDLSTRAGLVLLVEGPLDRKVYGELALDQPNAAVETIAQYAGYSVQTDDLVAYTLTPRQ